MRRVLSHELRAVHPDATARFAAIAGRTPTARTTLVAHALAPVRWDARAELAALRSPTVVLAGDRDRLLGIDVLGAIALFWIRGLREVVAAQAVLTLAW